MRSTTNKFSSILKQDVAVSIVQFIILLRMLGLYTLRTKFGFYCTKAILIKSEHRNNALSTIAFGRHHTVALNN